MGTVCTPLWGPNCPELAPTTRAAIARPTGRIGAPRARPPGGYVAADAQGEGGPVPALAHVFAKNMQKPQ